MQGPLELSLFRQQCAGLMKTEGVVVITNFAHSTVPSTNQKPTMATRLRWIRLVGPVRRMNAHTNMNMIFTIMVAKIPVFSSEIIALPQTRGFQLIHRHHVIIRFYEAMKPFCGCSMSLRCRFFVVTYSVFQCKTLCCQASDLRVCCVSGLLALILGCQGSLWRSRSPSVRLRKPLRGAGSRRSNGAFPVGNPSRT